MNTAIVTGANGFVGKALVKELLSRGVYVIAITRDGRLTGVKESDNIEILSCEMAKISKIPDILKNRGIDVFYHLAWEGSAGPGRFDTDLQLHNVKWTIEALKTAKLLECRRFVCAGSIMEDEALAAATASGNKPGPGYIYGCGKLTAHIMCKSMAAQTGIDLIWAKITNAYGEGEKSPRFINTTIQRIINNEILRFTTAHQNYDFVYITDAARALYLIGEKGKPFYDYIIGSSHARPLREFITEMANALGYDKELLFGEIPFTGIDLPLEVFDCTMTEKDTGFKAKVPFCDGVRKTRDWLIREGMSNDTKV